MARSLDTPTPHTRREHLSPRIGPVSPALVRLGRRRFRRFFSCGQATAYSGLDLVVLPLAYSCVGQVGSFPRQAFSCVHQKQSRLRLSYPEYPLAHRRIEITQALVDQQQIEWPFVRQAERFLSAPSRGCDETCVFQSPFQTNQDILVIINNQNSFHGAASRLLGLCESTVEIYEGPTPSNIRPRSLERAERPKAAPLTSRIRDSARVFFSENA